MEVISTASKVIRIDSEVYQALQRKAEEKNIPFSNANNIIRLVLNLEPLKSPRHQ